MLFDDIDRMKILTEAFFGKPKEFKKVEQDLAVIMTAIRTGNKFTNINKMSELDDINRILTKYFNVDSITVTFYVPALLPSVFARPGYNAFTIPTGMPIIKRDKKAKYGFDTFKTKINVHIDAGMIVLVDYTPGEVLALILHEIGHNMDVSFFYILSMINLDFSQLILNKMPLGIFIAKNTFMHILDIVYAQFEKAFKISSKIDNLLTAIGEEIPRFTNIYMWLITYVENALTTLTTTVAPILTLKLVGGPAALLAILNPSNIFGYGNEKFADSFATAHGYGVELSSALNKTERKEGLILDDVSKECGLVAIPFDILNTTFQSLIMLFDPHPQTGVRIKSQLRKLKRDLNDPNLNPEIKKELLQQIKDMEEFIVMATDLHSDENKRRIIITLNNKLAMDTLGYAHYRELMQLIRPREI